MKPRNAAETMPTIEEKPGRVVVASKWIFPRKSPRKPIPYFYRGSLHINEREGNGKLPV